MATIELLLSSAHADVLPRHCVITGSTKDVDFKAVQVPTRAGGLVAMTLPFADIAYRRWRAAHLLFRMAMFIAMFLFVVGMTIAWAYTPMGLLVYAAGVLLPIGTHYWIVTGCGPEVLQAGTKGLVLNVPSESAAVAIQTAVNEHEVRLATARASNE